MSIFQWRLDGFSQNIYLLQNYQVLELKNKGRALLSSSLARATRVLGTAILMCYAVQLVWIYGNKSLQIVCKYTCDFAFWAFFSKTGKTRVSHGVKMMTRWPGRERWPKWPINPVTQWPSSMSVADAALAKQGFSLNVGQFASAQHWY